MCECGYSLSYPNRQRRALPDKRTLTQSPKLYRFAVSFLPVVLITAIWLTLFWPMLCGSAIPGYRDSTYLYYPMFQWIDWQMQQGEFPLWMPYEDTGFPLLADGTSSLLYPVKAIFWLRFLSFPARYSWYLALHVLLAAGGSYALTKTMGANRWGATLAAISYAFGGSVLFQVCNVVYLVSAAWLPWALRCVWIMVGNKSNATTVIAASVCCSMMIFGGDPQMVYHLGLIAAATTMVFGVQQFWLQGVRGVQRPERATWIRTVICLGVWVALTSVLSAVQLLPTIQWARLSDRAIGEVAMNIYDGDFDSLVNLPDRPPVSDIYQFSQEPWSVLGLLFPNVFGIDAPVNTRWSDAFPGADRIWVPSNYFGCVVLLLALSGFAFYSHQRKGRGRAERVWLTWIAAWFCLASFGWYGISWLMTECGFNVGPTQTGTFHQPVGGLYWLMVTVLPKYCLFRYPAKLMVISCLALSVLAGVQLRPRGIERLIPFCWLALIVGLQGVVVLILPQTIGLLRSCDTVTLFGPFLFEQSLYTIFFALFSTVVCCCCLLVAAYGVRVQNDCRRRRRYRWLFVGVIGMTMFEVGINNRWMLHPIDAAVMTVKTATQRKITALREVNPNRPLAASVLETDFANRGFLFNSSEQRVAELALWRREMLFPKTHLLVPHLKVWGSFTSIRPTAFDHINPQFVAREVDARIVDVEGTAELKFTNVPLQNRSPLEKFTWHGQTLYRKVTATAKDSRLTELRLPLLPTGGWRVLFHSAETTGEVLERDVYASGPLESTVSIPESLRGKSFEVNCVYRPASFLWGRWISGWGWLAVVIVLILIRRKQACLSLEPEMRLQWEQNQLENPSKS